MLTLKVHGSDWWMVTHLLTDESVFRGHEFVGFTKQGVEWLICTTNDLVTDPNLADSDS
jgi:hypothetical protein